jgi:hypothetical protein
MNLFKKIKLFWTYRQITRVNKVNLESKFGLRLDRADRMYTVLNIPESIFQEPYNLRSSDIEVLSQKYVKEYISEVSKYLGEIGLGELCDFYEPIKRVEKYSFLIVLGYKPFNSVRYKTIMYYRILPVVILLSIIGLSIVIF